MRAEKHKLQRFRSHDKPCIGVETELLPVWTQSPPRQRYGWQHC